MSFINKNANISQTVLLTSILKPLLENYNTFLLSKNNLNLNPEYHLVPNNNQKYFLYITQKNKLERINSNQKNYNILYFFPDKISKEYYSNNKLESNKISDFYIEIDLLFTFDILLEGYLYRSKEGKLHYLLTDILYKNTDLISFDYTLRFNLLNEIFMPIKKNLTNLNDHLYINLHPVFNNINENMISIFKHNFIFKEQICCLEKIELFSKERSIIVDNIQKEESTIKLIEKTKHTDVYNVFDKTTNNKHGILYIKGINDSKYIKQLFDNGDSVIEHSCSFNKNFNKWQLDSTVFPKLPSD